jgi:hypothetical protein
VGVRGEALCVGDCVRAASCGLPPPLLPSLLALLSACALARVCCARLRLLLSSEPREVEEADDPTYEDAAPVARWRC